MRGLPAWLTLVGVLLIFVVPASLLDQLGLAYSKPAGAPWEKIHPATELMLAAVLLAAVRRRNPLAYLKEQGRRFPGLAIFLVSTSLLMVYLIEVQRAPFTSIIDTFLMPMLLFTLLVDLPDWTRRAIAIALHVILCFNAALGIYEFLTGWHLIPTTADELTLPADVDWRAYGLMGHPLSSAATAGLYAVIVALGGGRPLPNGFRPAVIALQLASLAAFGGRTALTLTAISLIGVVLVRVFAVLAGRKFDRRRLGLGLLLSPFVGLGAVLLIEGGYFDQVLSRFVDDNGSARSREIIFELFSQLSWQDILLGPDQTYLASLLHMFGIEVGVESFWLGFIVLCGLLMSLIFFAALAAFMVHVMRQSDLRALLPLAFFVVIISSSIGLSAKSIELGRFIAMMMILMPKRRQAASVARPAADAAWPRQAPLTPNPLPG